MPVHKLALRDFMCWAFACVVILFVWKSRYVDIVEIISVGS